MEQQNHRRKGGSVRIASGLYVEPMAEHGPKLARSKAMMDKESPAGSWKQAIQWMKQVKNDAPVADRPNADDYRNRAERAEAECKEIRRKLDVIAAILRDL